MTSKYNHGLNRQTSSQAAELGSPKRRIGSAVRVLGLALSGLCLAACAEPMDGSDPLGLADMTIEPAPAAMPQGVTLVDGVGAPTAAAPTADAAAAAPAPAAPLETATLMPTLPNGPGTWVLDKATSFLSLITTKQTDIAEVHTFETFIASVDVNGTATLVIDLASIATNADLRDERVRTHLFETALFPTASATFQVDMNALNATPVGSSVELPVTATFSLHGMDQALDFKVWVARMTDSQVTVSTTKPIVLNAMNFNMGAGIQTLIELAGLQSISAAVPVEFMFTLNRQ